jgi:cytochrome P450
MVSNGPNPEEEADLVRGLEDESFIADPFPVYRQLARWPGWRAPSGYVVFSSYDDVLAILKNPDVFGQEGRAQPSFHVLDPPDHTRLRRLVSRAFTPRSIEHQRADVELLANGLVDEYAGVGQMDVVEDFAKRLPALVISSLLDIPLEDGRRWAYYLDVMAASRGLSHYVTTDQARRRELDERRRAVTREQADLLSDLIAARKGDDSGSDIVSSLLRARDEGDSLTSDEVLFTLLLFLGAGMHTTAGQIGTTLKLLLERPAVLAALRAHPSLIPNATEEALRFEGSLQAEHRIVRVPFELSGARVQAGDRVILVNGAANRDPRIFTDPDVFDIRRPNARDHLTFGRGIHVCLGAALARIEIQVALETLLARLPGLRSAGRPRYQPYDRLRGLAELRVEWDAPRAA